MKSVIKTSLKVLTAKEKHHHEEVKPNVVEVSKVPALQMTPLQVLDYCGHSGETKGEKTWDQTLLLGIQAGAFIGLGSFFALYSAGNNEGFTELKFQGLQKLVFGMTFPVGLLLVIFTGAELFTSNIMYMTCGLYQGRANILQLIKNWFWSWIGNCLGGLIFLYFFVYVCWPGQKDAGSLQDPWIHYAQKVAKTKVGYEWHVLFLKAIACNWIVCMSVFCALACKDTIGRFMMFYFPIVAFIVGNYEHCIANAFLLPCGFLYGAEHVDWLTIGYNMSIVTVGNIIGGSLFFTMVEIYCYDFREKFKYAEENIFMILLYIFSGGKAGKIPFRIEIQKIEAPKETEQDVVLKPTPAPETHRHVESKAKMDEESAPVTNTEMETKVRHS